MMFFPEDAIEKIELNKIRRLAMSYCLGNLAKDAIDQEAFIHDYKSIIWQLNGVNETVYLLKAGKVHPIAPYDDIAPFIDQIENENEFLIPEQLVELQKNIQVSSEIESFFREETQKAYIQLKETSKNITPLHDLMDKIDQVIDDHGEIKSSASVKLGAIRSSIRSKQGELDKLFSKILKKYKKSGLLADNAESIKYGRRVLCLPVENKRKIDGIIHAESSSGKTIFMEPKEITLLNNQISELRIDEKNEIYRILRELTSEILPFADDLLENQKWIIQFDLWYAKSKLAIEMDAIYPEIEDKPAFNYFKARHPYLYIQNKKQGRDTIPFDLYLNHKNRMILLSGPNAGGKTVCLKTVGLMQGMLQSGYLIPVSEGSTAGVFKNIFVELGDQQSIENELSTYSSRLLSMKRIMDVASDRSLILIDEFGSGTDPRIGGAIAEAMLEALLESKAIALITTHYDNLKKFAFKRKGIINASMLFDMKNISPTYELRIGKPGSSYGLEIAQRMGLPEKLIHRARNLIGKKQVKVEDLLNDIEQEKIRSAELKAQLDEKNIKLDRLIRQFEQLQREFDVKRKKLKLEAREIEAQRAAVKELAIEKYMKELKEKKLNKDQGKKLALEIKKKSKESKERLDEVTHEYMSKLRSQEGNKKALEIGDHVRMRTGSTSGEIVDFKNEQTAIMKMGMLTVDVPIRDLVPINEPLEVRKIKSVELDSSSSTINFQSKLDIRGFKMREAERIVEEFFDKALLTGATSLRILHGKGSGVLKRVVWSQAKQYKAQSIQHAVDEKGGEGVSIIHL